jgi:hypothetical protein
MIGRYLLFVFAEFYASGGWNDLRGDFNSEQEALTAMAGIFDEGSGITEAYHAQIVDRCNGKWTGYKLESTDGEEDNLIVRQDGVPVFERQDDSYPFRPWDS